jgi:hypothetical protein
MRYKKKDEEINSRDVKRAIKYLIKKFEAEDLSNGMMLR